MSRLTQWQSRKPRFGVFKLSIMNKRSADPKSQEDVTVVGGGGECNGLTAWDVYVNKSESVVPKAMGEFNPVINKPFRPVGQFDDPLQSCE
jgi:hypothetical protein